MPVSRPQKCMKAAAVAMTAEEYVQCTRTDQPTNEQTHEQNCIDESVFFFGCCCCWLLAVVSPRSYSLTYWIALEFSLTVSLSLSLYLKLRSHRHFYRSIRCSFSFRMCVCVCVRFTSPIFFWFCFMKCNYLVFLLLLLSSFLSAQSIACADTFTSLYTFLCYFLHTIHLIKNTNNKYPLKCVYCMHMHTHTHFVIHNFSSTRFSFLCRFLCAGRQKGTRALIIDGLHFSMGALRCMWCASLRTVHYQFIRFGSSSLYFCVFSGFKFTLKTLSHYMSFQSLSIYTTMCT